MLARSFLTPEELNISDKQFDALVQVLGMLERGELPWHKDLDALGQGFNMQEWPMFNAPRHCGTIGCIGFWTEKLMNEEIEYCKDAKLSNLFFIDEKCRKGWDSVTPEHAAQAIRNYLGTGKANWASVLA